jgi:hypothetical protein
MTVASAFHYVTVGTTAELVRNLWDPIAHGSGFGFSHLVHPGFNRQTWPEEVSRSRKYFFVEDGGMQLPPPDRKFLSSLESDGVPTIHNMILGDRVVCALPYAEALGYATLLARRLVEVFREINPAAVIGGFDAIHGSLALAVARYLGIPWFALHFSTIPQGFACFCDRESPSARVLLKCAPSEQAEELASRSLQQFEAGEIAAPAYMAPTPRLLSEEVANISSRISTLNRMLRSGRDRGMLRYTEPRTKYRVVTAVQYLLRSAQARKAVARHAILERPPSRPYVLFGLHMQPESSIDVWAPFFSNQMWVIELLSRSIPPTHKLLVKIHKSDTAKYSSRELRKMRAYPGVELIAPFADTRYLIENADLIVMIQGTMGLEAALIGKPVIMLGQSPFTLFPSVTQAGDIVDLPALVRKKLGERRPSRASILKAYVEYLRPFAPASTNDWTVERQAAEVINYRRLFDRLRKHIEANWPVSAASGRASI